MGKQYWLRYDEQRAILLLNLLSNLLELLNQHNQSINTWFFEHEDIFGKNLAKVMSFLWPILHYFIDRN
jgi:hypothetical protein